MKDGNEVDEDVVDDDVVDEGVVDEDVSNLLFVVAVDVMSFIGSDVAVVCSNDKIET